MRKLLVAGLMVVLATPAFAAIQNVKVSGDITTSWIDDTNLDLGANASPLVPAGQKSQNVFVTQTRLRVDADLSDNVSTTVGLINERAWNAEGSVSPSIGNTGYDTNVQLYLASLTLREFLYSPLTLQIGRQVFTYGNGLILGDGGDINTASGNLGGIYSDLTERVAYDGVTATLDYKPLTISLIYFKNGQSGASITGAGDLTSGQSSDVYGYDANYQLSDPWSTVVEQYLFTRINGAGFPTNGIGLSSDSIGGPGADKGDTMYVPGLRASTNPTKNLNLQGEVAWELGNVEVSDLNYGAAAAQSAHSAGERRDAMLAQFLATYSLPILDKYKPTVNAGFTYASGDKDQGSNYDNVPYKSSRTYGAWDEFNTIQGAGTIYRAIFPLSNEDILSAGASISPLEDVTAAVTWSGLWAAEKFGTYNPLIMIQPNGTSFTPATKSANTAIGNETDVNLTYNYTEDVTFGLSLGWFVPGSVFTDANKESASQAIANVGVKF